MQAPYYKCVVIQPQEELNPSPLYLVLLMLGLNKAGQYMDLDHMSDKGYYFTTTFYREFPVLIYIYNH